MNSSTLPAHTRQDGWWAVAFLAQAEKVLFVDTPSYELIMVA